MFSLTFNHSRTFREDLEKLQKDNEEMSKQLTAQGSLNATLSKVIIQGHGYLIFRYSDPASSLFGGVGRGTVK